MSPPTPPTSRKLVPRPTAGELAILSILWERGPSTVRQVHEELARTKDTGYTTTLKLLQIMTDKGLVRRRQAGAAHVYSPAARAQTTQRKLAGELMDKVFGGSAHKLILQVLSAGRVSPQEIKDIQELLKQHEGTGHDQP